MADIKTIPEGWMEIILVDCLEKVIDYRGKTPEKSNQGILTLSAKSVKTGFIDYSQAYYISMEEYNKFMVRGFPKKGDILMTTEAPLGCIAKLDRDDVAVAQRLLTLRGKKGILDNDYLMFYLLSDRGQHELSSRASGSTVEGIKRSEFEKVIIPLPSFLEQQAIASLLSSFDDKIELLREQNETLEKTAQTIFQEWFGKYGVEDELPEGWRVGKLEEVIENFDSKRIPISSDKRSNGIYPYYGATGINDYVEDYIFDGTYTLLGEDGSVIKENGKPFTQYVWGKIWVNNHAHVLQGKNGFSTELIKIILDRTDIAPFVNGAVQLKINQSNMNSIPVIISDKETLLMIDKLIQPIFSKLRNNFEQIQSLSKTRDELLPRLMSGEVRVEV